jgi:hypothetical protein
MSIEPGLAAAAVQFDLAFPLETHAERLIASDPDWQAGLAWGVPRPGHPEGQIVWHIREVLDNVEQFFGESPERGRLRLIAMVHDTFKHQVDRTVPRTATNTHEYLARRFTERFVGDMGVLEVVELHDRAFKIHRNMQRTGDAAEGRQRARELIARLGEHLGLYLMFYLCDNKTGDKTMEHYEWFKSICYNTT